MTNTVKTVAMTEQIYAYLVRQAEPPSAIQQRLIEQTRRLGSAAEMQIPHEQAVFLTLLVKLTGAKKIVEVGTFTGYSTLALAVGMPSGGQLITCDVSADWGQIAQDAWRQAGVADRIDLRLGPAGQTLRRLPETADVDLVFLDADKTGYIEYWDLLVPRVRPGGMLLADNVLYYGEAADELPEGNAAAIAAFNAHVRADSRVESVVLPIADGLTVARKKTREELS
ncbi:O-methyltransferase [Nocardia goodfellowii]|uniref:Caffeoyl-CoA O-methyltransferase n=1 Tax=Nocardia goodfellowii TaxID=882446 RepID=A0ABS4QN47_9NOCA|nr:class I SAM-dependent methyltransferase [Nocardia goodfellowii]MBP2193122.1 caffeoyl-CoA O-methyltransferase [Nocardia goodfellowii]